MARADGSVKQNPKIISHADTCPTRSVLAADSVTWKKGEIGYLSSGTVTPISTTTGGVTAPYFQFQETQATSTSSTTVKVKALQPGCRMEVFVRNGASDATIGSANIGTKYGLYTASNICTLDVGVTSNADWEVEALAADYEAARNVTADSPGKCIIILR